MIKDMARLLAGLALIPVSLFLFAYGLTAVAVIEQQHIDPILALMSFGFGVVSIFGNIFVGLPPLERLVNYKHNYRQKHA